MTTQPLPQDRKPKVISAANRFSVEFSAKPDPLDALAAVAEEHGLIALILNYPAYFDQVAGRLSRDSFYEGATRMFWEAFHSIVNRGRVIEIVTVTAALKDIALSNGNRLDDILSRPELRQRGITDAKALVMHYLAKPFDEANVYEYVENIQQAAVKVRLVKMAEQIPLAAAQLPAPALGEWASAQVSSILSNTFQQHTEAAAMAEAYLHMVDNAPKLPFLHPEMQKDMKGYQAGEVGVLAGIQGLGKTSMVLSWIIHLMLTNPVPTILVSLEMNGTKEIMMNIIGMLAGIPNTRMRERRLPENMLTPDEEKRIAQAVEVVKGWSPNLQIVDEYKQITPEQLRVVIRRTEGRYGIKAGCIWIDGLWLMDRPASQHAKKFEMYGHIANDLQEISDEFASPIWITHQLNNEINRRKGKVTLPSREDLKEGGDFLNTVDRALVIYNEFFLRKKGSKDTQLVPIKDRQTNQHIHRADEPYWWRFTARGYMPIAKAQALLLMEDEDDE